MTVRSSRRSDIILALAGLGLGALLAAGYGAFRAVNDDGASTGERFATLGASMLFPGVLIILGVAVMVWLGWKANIDG